MNLYQILIFIVCLFDITYQRCGVTPEFTKKRKSGKIDMSNGLPDNRFLQSTSWTPIKIYVDYTTLNSQLESDSYMTLKSLKAAMDLVTSSFTKLLSVKSTNQKLKMEACDPGEPNLNFSIDPKISSEGVDADLILFPYMIPGDAADIQAYAWACLLSEQNKRPIAGFIGIGNSLDFSKQNSIYYYSLLLLHEVNHILAFNSEYFDKFIDANGATLPLNKVTKKLTINDIERTLLITPKVVEAAKEHFNCSNVIGVELENQGGEGSAGSHWEARTILGEFMNAQDYPETVISKMSLALFEDSGWYKVNYFDAGLYKYGKNQGCNFLNTKCIENDKTSFPNEFRAAEGPMCLGSRSGKGYSSLSSKPDNLIAIYEYFSDRTLGGYLYADFCPVAQGEISDDSYYFLSSCWMGNPLYTSSLQGETIGQDSYCFYSTVSESSYAVTDPNSICYKTSKCDANTKTYVVSAGTSTVTCSEGKTVKFDKFVGELQCLPFEFICTKSKPCNDVFECILREVTSVEKSSLSSLDRSSSSLSTKKSNYLIISSFLICILFILVN